jgi:hypothetical protein
VYERRYDNNVFYIIPVEITVESILKKLSVVPVGKTGTIPYPMLQHTGNFVGAAFDTRGGAGDGRRWWYINTWAWSWLRERGEK